MSVGELCVPALPSGEGAPRGAPSADAPPLSDSAGKADCTSACVPPLPCVPVIGLDTSRHAQAAVLERTVLAARVRRSDHNRARSARSRASSAPANLARPVVPSPELGPPVSGPYAPRSPWSVALGQSLGHDLMVTAGLVWCRQCAGYLCHFPRLLRAECDHGFPLGRKSAVGALPYSRARTLERLFRGEHPDSGRHIGIPRRIPRVLPLSCPTPNGVEEAQREPPARAFPPPLYAGPSAVACVAVCASPLSPGPPASLVVACPVPIGLARVPGSIVPLSGTSQEVGSTGTPCPAIPPSILAVSLQRAASARVAAKATPSAVGRPQSQTPPVLLHPSASPAHDLSLGSRSGGAGVSISRRGRFRF